MRLYYCDLPSTQIAIGEALRAGCNPLFLIVHLETLENRAKAGDSPRWIPAREFNDHSFPLLNLRECNVARYTQVWTAVALALQTYGQRAENRVTYPRGFTITDDPQLPTVAS